MSDHKQSGLSESFETVSDIPQVYLDGIEAVLENLKTLREKDFFYSNVKPADAWPKSMIVTVRDQDFESEYSTLLTIKNDGDYMQAPAVTLSDGETFKLGTEQGQDAFKSHLLTEVRENRSERRKNLRQLQELKNKF